jgi:hypothetical protein
MQGIVSSLEVWGGQVNLTFSIVQLKSTAPVCLAGADSAHTWGCVMLRSKPSLLIIHEAHLSLRHCT